MPPGLTAGVRTRKRHRRLEKLAFFIPFLVILVAVIYVYGVNAKGPGQVIITAETSGRYYPARTLGVDATVGGNTGTTPFNVSLSEGTYTVYFGSLPWFATPAPRAVTVLPGVPVYAIGTYDPVLRTIVVTQSAFNTTSVTAFHTVTPVVWVNTSGGYVVLNIAPVGRVLINPGQNFTHVFSQPGTYDFGFYFGGAGGSVTVS